MLLFREWNVTVDSGFNLLELDEGEPYCSRKFSNLPDQFVAFFNCHIPSFVECLLRYAPKLKKKLLPRVGSKFKRIPVLMCVIPVVLVS